MKQSTLQGDLAQRSERKGGTVETPSDLGSSAPTGRLTARLRKHALLILGTGLLVVYVSRIDYREVASAASRFPVHLAILVLALNVVPGGLKSLRWGMLLRASGIRASAVRDYLAVSASFFLGLVTPGTSGEFSRALTLGSDAVRGLLVVSFEKLTDLGVLFVLVIVSAILEFTGGRTFCLTLSLLGLGIVAAYVVYVRHTRLFTGPIKMVLSRVLYGHRIQNVRKAYWDFDSLLRNTPLLLTSSCYSLALWAIPLVQTYLIYKGLGLDMPLKAVALTYFLAYLVGVLSMIPFGLGTFDLGLSGIALRYATARVSPIGMTPLFYRAFVTLPLVLFGYACQVALSVWQRRGGST